jgi:Mg2+/Co2+ transporter CorB
MATEALDTVVESSGGSLWTAGAILGLLMLSAFFSGSETAMTAVSRAKLRRAADQGSRAARRVIGLTDDGETLIGAILIGNNVVNILATSLATSLALSLFGDSGVAIATLVMTVLVMIFAEVLPKTYAFANSEKASLIASRPIGLLVKLFYPIVMAVQFIVRHTLSTIGIRLEKGAHVLSHEAHEEIRGAIDLHHYESGSVEKSDRDRLVGALDLGDREVSEVMMHRRNIMMLNADSPAQDLIEAVLESAYTRIPLWRDEPENIVGVIHAKDLLRAVDKLIRRDGGGLEGVDNLDILKIAMEPWFVPDTTSLADQLREFLSKKSHFALVVDEYGALQGLITLEDIIEEIVGEIEDEHDIETDGVTREADGAYLADGTVTIRDLNRYFDWTLPDEEATTIAGLVIHEAQAIPAEGQSFVFHDFRFDIVSRVRNQITQLRIRPQRRI